jgi:hypothetical protein
MLLSDPTFSPCRISEQLSAITFAKGLGLLTMLSVVSTSESSILFRLNRANANDRLNLRTFLLDRQTSTFPNLTGPVAWFRERFDRIKETVPSFLRPKYFALVMNEAYKAARRAVIEQCSEFISTGHSFTQDLALCSVQMYGKVESASIDPGKSVPSLAAGLPHFATNWARCWGRDVSYLSLLLLVFLPDNLLTDFIIFLCLSGLYLPPRSLPHHRPVPCRARAHSRLWLRSQAWSCPEPPRLVPDAPVQLPRRTLVVHREHPRLRLQGAERPRYPRRLGQTTVPQGRHLGRVELARGVLVVEHDRRDHPGDRSATCERHRVPRIQRWTEPRHGSSSSLPSSPRLSPC